MSEKPRRPRGGNDARAVSPVIGVILMVAITVILAALVGSFILDFGQSAKETAPQASLQLSVDNASDVVEIEHLGGDKLRLDETRVVVTNDGTTTFNATASANGDGIFGVGDRARITLNTTNDDSLDFDGNGVADVKINGAAQPIDIGDSVTVKLIDTDTNRFIFEGSVQVTR